MIQELFGIAAGLIPSPGENNKISINGGTGIILDHSTIIPPNSTSSSTANAAAATNTTAIATATTSSNSETQNLRCPRCDSSNTKFCYYNNYNLTQPRHFCKTCRRYWTKGGALRNVPIGGGCRKNKTSAVAAATISASVGKSSTGAGGKLKSLSSEIGRSGFGHVFDHEISPTQILWGSPSPQNSHLFSMLNLRSNIQNPNPNPNQTPNHNHNHPNTVALPLKVNETTPFHSRVGFDPVNHVPSLGLCSSYWRNNQIQNQSQNQQNGNGLITVSENQVGIQELYQKLRSTSGNYFNDQPPQAGAGAGFSNVASTSTILDSAAPVAGGQTGFWNPAFSWSDVHTSTHGSYP